MIDFSDYRQQFIPTNKHTFNCEQTSSAELGVGTPLVSGSLKVANPARPDNTAKMIRVPVLRITLQIHKKTVFVLKYHFSLLNC